MRFTLRLPESASLKDKRQVIRSLTQRLRNEFQVSVAEVADNEAWQIGTLGVACVSNSHQHCREVLDSVMAYVETSRPDIEVTDVQTDTIAMDGD
jgi:uncharacterized protein YlxP (DUF503 family)